MSFARALRSTVVNGYHKVVEINRRYATPRIAMSGAVRLSLLVLRIYLFLLVGLLVYKFITLLAP